MRNKNYGGLIELKILITGADGLLGAKLYNILSKKYKTIGTCFTKKKPGLYNLDIRLINQVHNLFENENPDVVIHTAAIIDANLCEEDKELARSTNVEGTRNIVMACKFKNSKLVYISSDYIFDGKSQKKYTEESEASPINYYGQTKLEGQKIVGENLDNYIIIRPGILYGYNSEEDRETYITKVIKTLKENKKLYADNNVIKYPTLIDDVALAIKKLIEINAKGTYHVASSEPVTRYEWAKRIAKIYNLPEKNIIAKNEEYKAKKPLNVFLDSSKIKKLGVVITNVDEGTKIAKQQQECMLRLLYSIRPGMEILKEDVSDLRINLGKKLAKEAPVKADIVVPIPETGIFPATGFAHESGIPLYHGLVKNEDIGRTLYEPSQINRSEKIRSKIVPVNSLIKDKKVVLIDEAIITGITTEIIIRMLKEAGAKEIHVRIPCPPFISACEAKQHPIGDLIARKYSSGKTKEERQKNIEEGVRKFFDVNSVKFLSLKSLLDTLKSGKYEKCVRCFLDEYEKFKLNGKNG